MSFPFYGKLWVATRKDLKDVILREKVLPTLAPTMDRGYAHRLIGNILTRYIVLCNNLSEIYDQTLQVQKRAVIEKLLISTTKRFLELQGEMKKIELSEFIYLDEALLETKLTPQNIVFLRPFYFPRRRDLEAQQVVDEIPKPSEEAEVEAPKGLEKFRIVLTPEEKAALELKKIKDKSATLIIAHAKAKRARVAWFNVQQFPEKFLPKPRELPTVPYEFYHQPDQIPMFKVKRTKYETNLFKPKMNFAKFAFYKPPEFRVNKLGHKVRVPRRKTEMEIQVGDTTHLSDSDDVDEVKKDLEGEKLKIEADEKLKQWNRAAKIIQRAYRGYRMMKLVKIRRKKTLELCGILEVAEDPDKPDFEAIEEERRRKRRERKREFDETFLQALEDEKARILKLKAPAIMEDISDDIRQWFKEFYDGAKDFHRYPEEFEGGTIMVMTGETMTPEEFLLEKNKTSGQKAKEKAEKKKAKRDAKKAKKKQKELDKKLELEEKALERKQGPTWNFADKRFVSENLADLTETFQNYETDWKFIDESANYTEAPIWDWVTIDAYADTHKELRLIVDDIMRIELELLRVALAVDNKKSYVPSKRKKPKKEKKKKKKKESVDLTEGRSLDECYEELKSWNIIRKYPKRSLSEFIGDESFAAHEFRGLLNKYPPAHYGDIKNTLRTLVLGMGPLELPKVKSLCLVGPPKCGKKILVDALCTEMDAVMFDLSAKIVAPIPNLDEVLSLLMQVAKKIQPVVIFIDGAHKPFIRVASDAERSEYPRKLGFFLQRKIIKKLNDEDAIMVIATTNQPWNCNFVQLRACYEKFIFFPPVIDYPTAVMVWKKGLRDKRILNFDVSPLAKVTRNYTIGDILEVIDGHVDLRRRMRLQQEPLTCEEIMEDMLTGPNARKELDELTITAYYNFAARFDYFSYDRYLVMTRRQIEIDKEKELKARRKKMQEKNKK